MSFQKSQRNADNQNDGVDLKFHTLNIMKLMKRWQRLMQRRGHHSSNRRIMCSFPTGYFSSLPLNLLACIWIPLLIDFESMIWLSSWSSGISINVLEKCLRRAEGWGITLWRPLGGDPPRGGESRGDLHTGDDGAVLGYTLVLINVWGTSIAWLDPVRQVHGPKKCCRFAEGIFMVFFFYSNNALYQLLFFVIHFWLRIRDSIQINWVFFLSEFNLCISFLLLARSEAREQLKIKCEPQRS